MTRWLQAAQGRAEARAEPTDTAPGLCGAAPRATERGVSSVSSVLSEGDRADPGGLAALNTCKESAAICEAAKAAALAEVANAAGIAPEALQRLWCAHPDTRAYIDHLMQHGPATVGAAGSALGWGATRAWQAEARLRAAGLVVLGPLGRAQPIIADGVCATGP